MGKGTSKEFGFIGRTLRTICIVLLVFFPFGIYYLGILSTLAILSGAVWGILNLKLISLLVKYTLRPEGPDAKRAIGLALIKFPLLYLSGYFLLRIPGFPVLSLLIGFSSVLGIMCLRLMGESLLMSDKTLGSTSGPDENSQYEIN